MRRDATVAGFGFWFLVMAFLALLVGRARADVPAAPGSPAVPGSPAAAPGSPAAAPGSPAAAPNSSQVAWRQFHGKLVFSDILIAQPAQFQSGDQMVEALNRLKRTSVQGTDGFWRMHMVAFLDPVPQTSNFRLRATDVTRPQDRRQVKVFEITGEPGQVELAINDLVLTEVMGFERGHRYEIAILPGGDDVPAAVKEDVYAKGVITLM